MGAEGSPQQLWLSSYHLLSCLKFPLAAGLEVKEMMVLLFIAASLPEHWSGRRGSSTQKLSLGSVMVCTWFMRKAIQRRKSQARRQCLVSLACLGLGT